MTSPPCRPRSRRRWPSPRAHSSGTWIAAVLVSPSRARRAVRLPRTVSRPRRHTRGDRYGGLCGARTARRHQPALPSREHRGAAARVHRGKDRPLGRETWYELDRITFETDSATLRPQSREQLSNVAAILKAYPPVRIKIGGYTDNSGDAAANVRLSQARAEAVLNELRTMGVTASRLEAEGYGQAHPVADNATPGGTRDQPTSRPPPHGAMSLSPWQSACHASRSNAAIARDPLTVVRRSGSARVDIPHHIQLRSRGQFMRRVFVGLATVVPAAGRCRTPLLAQSAEELAKQTQNPVASLISVPFQGNWDFGIGEREATGTTLNIQPVAPFGLTQEWNAILRVIMPVAVAADRQRQSASHRHGRHDDDALLVARQNRQGDLGRRSRDPDSDCDESRSSAPRSSASVLRLWRSCSLASGRSVRCGIRSGRWMAPTTATTSTRCTCSRLRTTTSARGWPPARPMEASANFEADDEQWTSYLLFSISKVTLLGKRPVSFLAAAGPAVAHPTGRPDWRLRFAATFLFPR